MVMVGESNSISLLSQPSLDQWKFAWYHEAAEAEFIRLPYHPDTETINRFGCYFGAGLSPREAAQACYGRKH